ncbi:endo alpha-1,4 polygalactosaminidase [Schaalia sp. 19OD2882]|uniref:endo alpha-1,4 polygalactosaminidase n=1 Tax=Schaalia sp. 19OD2882 TaxID=2794089 RepID=UPI001C1F11D2|nr:endo alpha-1,4 polygalactosaminidase [Schaalia sp. 19OD2882]QWW18882.1 endo alpha-1,4 polygalactosaminidase [Schaalia sp. 19OD2882]
MTGLPLAAACAFLLCACGSAPLSHDEGGAAQWWHPEQGLTWHLQLQGEVTPESLQVDVADLDGEQTTAQMVRTLRERGVRTICYIDAGSFEQWRSDAHRFPSDILGEPLEDWPGQRWVDVRRLDALLPIMQARINHCADKGFDAVDADDVDGYQNDTGFDLDPAAAATYVGELARLSHLRGLAFGLKNAPELLATVDQDIDFAVNEQCAHRHECHLWDALTTSGRPVFAVHYPNADSRGTQEPLDESQCPAPRPGWSMVLARVSLSGGTLACP